MNLILEGVDKFGNFFGTIVAGGALYEELAEFKVAFVGEFGGLDALEFDVGVAELRVALVGELDRDVLELEVGGDIELAGA